jgi:hypothetical protein
LRNIRSPIVVFCSKGDNVTPPQQALGWILDLYESVDEIRSYGQTIVYTVHESVGHLGIFVSGSVAKKQHDEFSSNIDLIDTLPPGLYEAVFERKTDDTTSHELVSGNWVMRCEMRTLDDIRAFGGNDQADERRFATAARVSETNLALYRAVVQPIVRTWVNAPIAEWMQKLHPLRIGYELFSDANPMMAWVGAMADQIRKDRRPISADNPYLKAQEEMSRHIVAALDGWREMNEAVAERMFLTVYGSPVLQAAVAIEQNAKRPPRKASRSLLHADLLENRIAELKSHIPVGEAREAIVRAMLYVGMSRAAIDERGFEAVRRIRQSNAGMPLSVFKAMVREQFNILLIDTEAALEAIPSMLPPEAKTRAHALHLVETALSARGEMSVEYKKRMDRVAGLFSIDKRERTKPLRLATNRQ